MELGKSEDQSMQDILACSSKMQIASLGNTLKETMRGGLPSRKEDTPLMSHRVLPEVLPKVIECGWEAGVFSGDR